MALVGIRLLRLFAAMTILMGASACSTQGVPEFLIYAQAFDAQSVESDKIFDALSVAERKVALRGSNKGPLPDEFDPDQAAYYVDAVDTPVVASLRGSLNTLKAYNDALLKLTDGASAAAVSAQIGVLSTNIGQTVGAFGIAQGSPFMGAALVGMDVPLKALLDELLKISAKDAFRKSLIGNYPVMRELLTTLRSETPTMFELMAVSRHSRDPSTGSGFSQEDLASIEVDRRLLSGWVLLLDQTLVTMEAAVKAAATQMSPTDLAALAQASIELRVLAEKVAAISRPQE